MKNLKDILFESILDDDETLTNKEIVAHPKSKEELQDAIINAIDNGPLDGSKKFYRMGDVIDLNVIDISEVGDDLSGLFSAVRMNNFCAAYDFDLSSWDVSKVTNMDNMFDSLQFFTGKSIEHWDVSSLKTAKNMFSNCERLDCDLSSWQPKELINAQRMFMGCYKFTGTCTDKWTMPKLMAKIEQVSNTYTKESDLKLNSPIYQMFLCCKCEPIWVRNIEGKNKQIVV